MLFRLAVGGPAVGLGFGVSCTIWMRFIYNNEMTEILLTIATAFAAYLVADQLADASGVLSVVTYGELCSAGLLPASSSCMFALHLLVPWQSCKLPKEVIAARYYYKISSCF